MAKINYHIYTDAMKENLIPTEITPHQMNQIYESEADVLDAALSGMTAKQWRDTNLVVTEKATYQKIKEYVKEKYGLNVHTKYIAEVKRKHGLLMHEAALNYFEIID